MTPEVGVAGPVRFTVLGADPKVDRLALGAGLAVYLTNGLTPSGRDKGRFAGDGEVSGRFLQANHF